MRTSGSPPRLASLRGSRPSPKWAGSSSKAILVLVTFVTFWFRAVLSDRNSYWLDELFSVESYVLPHANVLDAIRDLIDTSVHPPLYQFVLYFWVQLFGSTETATRTLSNLYVTIAIVFLHRWVLRLHGAAIANGAAITFALSYTVTFFGNETRSYAQTLVLVVLSSYALFRYVELLHSKTGLRRIFPGWPALVLIAANSALLLTHYYNLFYWAAQAIFAATLVFWTSEPGKRFASLPAVVSSYLVQAMIFIFSWGPTAGTTFARFRPAFETDVPQVTPLSVVAVFVEQNLRLGPLAGGTLLLVMLGLVVWRILDHRGTVPDPDARRRDTSGCAYSAWMAVGPLLLAYTAFLLIGAERTSPRFFVYVVPHLLILGVLAASQALTGVIASVRRISLDEARLHARRHALVYTLLLVMAFVVPGTIAAATHSKEDWRGIAADAIAIIDSSPDESFAIYQTSFRSTPMIDYYLRRFSDDTVTATGVIRFADESARDFEFEDQLEMIEAHDRLIVTFTHHSTGDFPVALARLESRYDAPSTLLDRNGRGIVMYDLSDVH